MTTPRVSVALIVRNEEPTLARCLRSVREAVDEIVVVDTGSTDATRTVARRFTDQVHEFAWCDDFAAARQFAFDRASGDWVAWLDADDVVLHAGNIRGLVGGAPADVSGFYWPYVYARDAWGHPRCTLWRERCVRNDGSFRWAGRAHEALVGPATAAIVKSTDVVVDHRPPASRAAQKQGRNLRILEAEYAAADPDGPSPRLLHYLASEHAAAGNTRKALELFARYLRVACWDDERYLAQVRVAELYRSLARYADALDADLAAVKVHPRWPDAYFGLAKTSYFLRDWPSVVHWTDIARALPEPETLCIVDPMAYRFDWLVYYTNALYHVGRPDDALAWTRHALSICPDDRWHRDNFFFYVAARGARAATGPARAPRAPRAATPSVAFLCPFQIAPWSPQLLAAHGAGGSETAVIEMAARLAGLGHATTVFNANDGPLRDRDVEYVDATRFDPDRAADVVIAWRAPEVADLGAVGEQRYLWMHDIDVGDRLTPARAERFTGILALSEAHAAHLRARYPFLDERRLIVTRNGLDVGRFEHEVARRPHRLVYSSSPDRGLDVLLAIFPRIRARVPDATLEIFYGWSAIDDDLRAALARLLDQPGVTYHGQVDQARLAREMLASALWVYPTDFAETSCITAMEAQAAGAVPITRPLAALAETVKFGVLLDGDVRAADTQARYVEAVVSLLERPEEQARIRADMVPWARARFGWDGVARQWHRWFAPAGPAHASDGR